MDRQSRLEVVTGIRLLRRVRDAVLAWADTRHIGSIEYLTAYLVLLFGVPASLVVGPLGAAGTPAAVVAAIGAGCWILDQLAGDHRTVGGPRLGPRGYPVQSVGALFVIGVLLSYVAAMSRPITGTEVNSIHTGLIMLFGWTGLVVIVADGIRSPAQLGVMVRRMAVGVGVCAAVGVAQFFTGRTLTDRIAIPGLSVNTVSAMVEDRNGFSRALGTTIHPIEFGVVVAAMLPLCIHVGRYGTGGRVHRWWPTAVAALGIPAANSRSGYLALLTVVIVILPLWPAALRWRAAAYGLVGLVGAFLLMPGLLGTIVGMFNGLSDNPTTTSRTGSYELGWSFIERAPVFGRGFKTFLPPYRVIDNQYLGLLIDTGFFGTLAMIALFGTGIGVAMRVRRRTRSAELASLAESLVAGIAAIAVSFAFFDALSFPTISALTALSLGLVDALWRIVRDERDQAQELQSGSRSPAPKNASTAARTR